MLKACLFFIGLLDVKERLQGGCMVGLPSQEALAHF